MLMTYEDGTHETIGRRAEQWTRDLLARLANDKLSGGCARGLTGHFSFDFIVSTRNGELYPIECNARVHTAVILLPLSRIADCYTTPTKSKSILASDDILRPDRHTTPRSWIYNDLVMRYLPRLLPSRRVLGLLHPSLPACVVLASKRRSTRPDESLWTLRLDPSLVADDPVPFLVLWHIYWPSLLLIRWWQGKYWTRVSIIAAIGTARRITDTLQLNVSTGRIFEA